MLEVKGKISISEGWLNPNEGTHSSAPNYDDHSGPWTLCSCRKGEMHGTHGGEGCCWLLTTVAQGQGALHVASDGPESQTFTQLCPIPPAYLLV